MPPSSQNEEIIEKRASSPVATSCLVLTAVALLGAITLQILEIAQYRSGTLAHADKRTPGALRAAADIDSFKKKADEILRRGAGATDEALDGADADEAGDAPAGDAKAATPDEAPAEEKAGDAADDAAAPADPEPAAEPAPEPEPAPADETEEN